HHGNINISDCNQCTPGWYCESYGLSEPTAECSPGYYCPGGQNTSQPVELACSPGHFCLEGSWNQTGCPSGYYQPHWRAYDCDICPQGSYCKAFGDYEVLDAENVTESGNFSGRYRSYRGVSVPTVCPAGSYCPMGTEFGTQYLCPEGTFSNRTSLYNDTQCEPCEPGMYCMGEGNTAPSDVCAAGHYCTQGADSATPTDGTTGDICPPGRYCEPGSITGDKCPKGSYSNQTGLTIAPECWNCTAGYYCGRTGLTKESGPCWAGYYCSGSSEEAAPVGMPYGDVCWPGHYCPNGTDIPDPCPPGTFLDISGAEEEDDCIACTPGRDLFVATNRSLFKMVPSIIKRLAEKKEWNLTCTSSPSAFLVEC
ncbi:putative multiple epidermal growth factor-like domains protein 11, partial [Apostichopus japonicus]